MFTEYLMTLTLQWHNSKWFNVSKMSDLWKLWSIVILHLKTLLSPFWSFVDFFLFWHVSSPCARSLIWFCCSCVSSVLQVGPLTWPCDFCTFNYDMTWCANTKNAICSLFSCDHYSFGCRVCLTKVLVVNDISFSVFNCLYTIRIHRIVDRSRFPRLWRMPGCVR